MRTLEQIYHDIENEDRMNEFTNEDIENIERSLMLTLTDLQKDLVTAWIYSGSQMLEVVQSKIEIYEVLRQKVRSL
jgi:hypothetical protein